MSDVLSEVVDIVSEVLEVPAQALRACPELAAHNWDSLSSLEALVRLESRFEVRLDLRRFGAARTVPDLAALVGTPATVAAA